MQEVSFFVPGIPATQGSKRAFNRKDGGTPIVVESCKGNKDWRGDVKRFAVDAYNGPPIKGPVHLSITFQLPRPKSHFGKRGLRPGAPMNHTIKPDLTKMLRAVEDALKGILWADDCQVVKQVVGKVYTSDRPGAQVCVMEG